MVRLIWTEEALDGLNQLAEYIAVSNPRAAKKLVQTVFEKVSRLEIFPESGRFPIELEAMAYREVIVSPCRIFYKIDGNKVYILYVFREERDLKKYLLQAGVS
jgi:toxin ParE1/3/4